MGEEERKDQIEDKGIVDNLKKTNKKGKSNFVMKARKWMASIATILHALPILLVFLGFLAIFAFFSVIFDLEGDSAIVDSATSTLIEEDVEIVEANNGEGHYFKIDQKIMDNFLLELNRAYAQGKYDEADVPELDTDIDSDDDDYYEDVEDEYDDDDGDFVYDEETAEIKKDDMKNWFRTEEYEEFMVKMIRAEIASSYPKLGDYDGEDGTEDKVRK